jgi:hypothetical protein
MTKGGMGMTGCERITKCIRMDSRLRGNDNRRVGMTGWDFDYLLCFGSGEGCCQENYFVTVLD